MTQSCLPQGILFSSQAQIDSFPIMHPNCHEIEGDVNIAGDNITNLNGLLGITSIGGYLYIENNSKLPRFTGLNNLVSIGKYLRIFDNNSLISLDGLENLDSIGDYLSLVRNPKLASLSGLDNLLTVNRISIDDNSALKDVLSFNRLTRIQYLFIESNSSLSNLAGFENLDSISSAFWIRYNANLINISGFDTLKYVSSLYIANNPALKTIDGFQNLQHIRSLDLRNATLTNLSGFKNLTKVKDNLSIQSNTRLSSLMGLSNLDSVGWLYISECSSLKSLAGLENIQKESLDQLTITNNDSLSECAVKSICEYLAYPGCLVEIHDNRTGCNSQAEVDTVCRHLSQEDLTLDSKFLIYPNPSSTSIIIETGNAIKDCNLAILNLNGQQLLRSVINDRKICVDIGKLQSGIYVIRIIQRSGVLNLKFIKN